MADATVTLTDWTQQIEDGDATPSMDDMGASTRVIDNGRARPSGDFLLISPQ